MLRSIVLVSVALGGCSSDSTDGQETNLTGGAASTGNSAMTSPESSDLGANAANGSAAGGDTSQVSAPPSGGAGPSDGPVSGGGTGEGLPAGNPPASIDSMPAEPGSPSMSGQTMAPLDEGSSPSEGRDEGGFMGDAPETNPGGDGSLPMFGDEPSMDGDPPAQDEPDMGGGDGDPADEESTSDDPADDEPTTDEPAEEAPVTFATCPDDNWNLVWGDDFDGPAGSAVDGGKWAYDSGPNWYNGELQYYAAGTDNAFLDGNGNLVIEARREDREGRQYTSARLKTEGKHSFTYGRFEGRMKLPYGQGMWPALWMLGGTRWPDDGEIDIMENLGREPSIAHGTIHGPGYSGANGPGTAFTLPDGEVFSDDFHIFAVEWEPEVIRWYIDGEHYSTKTPADVGGNRWVFDHPFFFLVNLAVGGEWPGNPDETTVFPQQFLIDYIRVCQQ